MDFTKRLELEFQPPDHERFPCLGLAYRALEAGGSAPAALNAANEEAVRGFLAGRIRFTDIAAVCGRLLDEHPFQEDPDLDEVRRLDAWARQEVAAWAST